MAQSLIDKAGIKHTQEEWKKGGKTGSNPWLHSEDLNWEGWKDWAGDVFVGIKDYTYKGLPEDATYKDYMFELQKSRQPEQYNSPKSFERGSDAEGQKILADINKKFPDRKKDDAYTGPIRHKGEKGAESLEIKEALRKGQFTKDQREYEEAKKKAEEKAAFLDSPKGRLQTLWADADQRDAILGGIMDSMTEVKFGPDAYQSRFHDTQKNIRQNLRVAEATKLARQKAQLDMYKVAAETSKLANPAQYMTNSQKDAMAIVTASGIRPGTPEWNQEYARQLQQIVVKDLTSAKASAIQPLYTFAQVLLNSQDAQEKLTGEAMMRAIESIAGYLSGTDTGGGKSQRAEIVVEEETTT